MDPKRTYHANQAVHMSDLLNLRFAKERFGTERPRYLRVREPDGPSTAGGKRARQAVTLIDFENETRSTIVCGFIDTVNKKAELRGFPMVKQAFESRFSVPIDITRGEYLRMMAMLQDFMAGQGIETRLVNERVASRPSGPSPAVAPPVLARSTPTPIWAWVGLGFVLGFVACYSLVWSGLALPGL